MTDLRLVHHPWTLAVVASMSIACPAATQEQGSRDAKSDPAAKADAGKAAEVEAPPQDQGAGAGDKNSAARKKFAEHDEAEITAARAKMVATLNEGRRLVKDGKLDEGIAKYRELLAIDPHYGPALGELGWAEYKAGRYESARAHTLKALTRAPDNERRGMLHYNLGRIAEDRGQTEIAIEAYALSLTLRPNEVVAGRLAELTPGERVEDFAAEHPAVEAYEARHGADAAAAPALLSVAHAGLASPEAACAALLGERGVDGDDSSCELTASPSGDETWGLFAVSDYDIERFWYPAVKTDAGWTVFANALYGQHGSEVDQDVDTLAAQIVSNDAGEFLVIEYSDHLYERDWAWGELEEDDNGDDEGGIPDDEMQESRGVIICRRGPKPVCTAPIITSWDGWVGEGHDTYRASVTMKGETIVIADVEIEGEVELGRSDLEWNEYSPLPAGEYAFEDLE